MLRHPVSNVFIYTTASFQNTVMPWRVWQQYTIVTTACTSSASCPPWTKNNLSTCGVLCTASLHSRPTKTYSHHCRELVGGKCFCSLIYFIFFLPPFSILVNPYIVMNVTIFPCLLNSTETFLDMLLWIDIALWPEQVSIIWRLAKISCRI